MQEILVYLNNLSDIERIYMICLLVGLGVPLLNVVLGIFGDIGDLNMHTDTDMHIDGHFGSFSTWLPLSPLCWSMFLLVGGGAGLLVYPMIGTRGSIFAAVALGYLLMIIANKCILLPLKRSDPKVLTSDDLIGSEAIVTARIRANSIGAIIVVKDGITLEYSSKIQENKEILVNSKVIIKSFDGSVAIVEESK